jgi:hypothetical protein
MDTRLLSIVGLLLVIFIGAMLSNSDIVGYSSAKSLNEYPYEGFAQIQEKFEARDEKKKYAEALSPKEAFGPIEMLSPKEAFGPIEMLSPMDEYEKKKYAEALTPMEAFKPMDSSAIKVAGFKGIQSGAYGNEKIIGFMYNNESNTSCKPYGYTNSKGNICMSPEDIKMLTTRGGNAAGASDQIGK